MRCDANLAAYLAVNYLHKFFSVVPKSNTNFRRAKLSEVELQLDLKSLSVARNAFLSN